MNTKRTVIALVGTLFVLFAGFNFYKANHDQTLTGLMMQNVEALAADEGSDCNNSNGYRRILEGNERIYDCCYKEKIGKGKEDCKRW